MNIYKSSCIVLLLLLANLSLLAQTKTNLEIIKVLVDSSVADIVRNAADSGKDIFLNLKLGNSYPVLEDQIYKSFQMRGKNLSSVYNPLENSELSYTAENAVVTYGENFRDGFLGGHYVSRFITLEGSYRFHHNSAIVENFSYKSADTVRYDEIESLENSSYPFTKGEIPSEPFLSNLFEPLVAITTAAIVITLFFTVRSK
jgi:hypothetical protein